MMLVDMGKILQIITKTNGQTCQTEVFEFPLVKSDGTVVIISTTAMDSATSSPSLAAFLTARGRERGTGRTELTLTR